ncbi:hypothetical protein D3C85_1581920 [compost metagenome]
MEAVLAPFTAVAASLHSAEGGMEVKGAVDDNPSSLNSPSDRTRKSDIFSRDKSCEAVVAVVGDQDRLVQIAVALQGHDRAEDFFTGYSHVGRHRRKDGGPDIIAQV